MTDQHHDQFSASVQDDWYLVENEGELHPNLGKMGTLHLDKPKLRGSDYFGAMNQRKQELRAFDYFGAMHLDHQFQNKIGNDFWLNLSLQNSSIFFIKGPSLN